MSTDILYEDGKLYVTRIYNAPREAVFEAWVETSKVQQWWGCAQTTNVCSEIEPQVGGKYNHLMTIEGAGQFPACATFKEFNPPARLVYVSEANQMSPAMTVNAGARIARSAQRDMGWGQVHRHYGFRPSVDLPF